MQEQIRVCNANSKTMAAMRNTEHIGGKGGELGAQLERVAVRGRPAGVAQSRDDIAQSEEAGRAGAAMLRVVVRCCAAWVDAGGLRAKNEHSSSSTIVLTIR